MAVRKRRVGSRCAVAVGVTSKADAAASVMLRASGVIESVKRKE
jgi:hypothetical protein